MKGIKKILYLISKLERIDGRKKLQKIVYILQYLGYPFHEEFNYHYFGPFSEELTEKIKTLVAQGLIEEDSIKGGFSYSIKDKESVDDILKSFNAEKIDELVEKIGKLLNEKQSNILELTSTILFLKDHLGLDEREAFRKAIELKANLKSLGKESLSLIKAIKT